MNRVNILTAGLLVMAASFAAGPALAQTCTISGTVQTAVFMPIPDVTLSGLPGNPTTDASGYYSATVACGWSGTVTPTLGGYRFNPPSRTYTNVSSPASAENYLGWLPRVTISGYVTLTGAPVPLPNVTMNGLPGPPITDAMGWYSVTVAGPWSGTVTPTLAGHAFTPSSRTYTGVMENQSANFIGVPVGLLTVSGRVRTSDGVAIPGVTIVNLPGPPVTDASGFYSAQVNWDYSGTVVPTLGGYTFFPPSQTYVRVSSDMSGQDYVGAGPGSR